MEEEEEERRKAAEIEEKRKAIERKKRELAEAEARAMKKREEEAKKRTEASTSKPAASKVAMKTTLSVSVRETPGKAKAKKAPVAREEPVEEAETEPRFSMLLQQLRREVSDEAPAATKSKATSPPVVATNKPTCMILYSSSSPFHFIDY